jgi:serine protease
VAATAALVIASGVLGPRPKPAQILARLEQTTTPLGCPLPTTPPGCARGHSPDYGYGMVNAGAATARQIVPASGG